jgi:hypothetical protein
MSRVHEDAKGLYVICNGSHYRPEVTEVSRWQILHKDAFVLDRWPTIVNKGEWVKAKHIRGSVLAKIEIHDIVEIWTAHEPSNEMKRIMVEQKLDKN